METRNPRGVSAGSRVYFPIWCATVYNAQIANLMALADITSIASMCFNSLSQCIAMHRVIIGLILKKEDTFVINLIGEYKYSEKRLIWF